MSEKQPYAENVKTFQPKVPKKDSGAAAMLFGGPQSKKQSEVADKAPTEKKEVPVKEPEAKTAVKTATVTATAKPKKENARSKPEKAPASRSKASQKQNRASALFGIKKNDGRIQRSYYIEKKFVALIDEVFGDDRGRSDFINDALRNFVLNNLPEYKDKVNPQFHANIEKPLPFDEKKWADRSTQGKIIIRKKKKSEFTVQRSYYLETEIVEVLDDLFGDGGSGRSDLVNMAIRFFILTYMEEFADSIDIQPPY